MRLVHRRNNPNKETLIHIPLSHATGKQAYRIRVANHTIVNTGIHDKYNINLKQEQVIVKAGIITGIAEIIISIPTGNITGNMPGISRIITISITVTIYYYYYSSDPYISVCVQVCTPTHIHPYIARRGLLTEANGGLTELLIVISGTPPQHTYTGDQYGGPTVPTAWDRLTGSIIVHIHRGPI